MPRGAWLGLGAVAAALAAAVAGSGPLAMFILLAGVALAPVATILVLGHRLREAALLAGVATVCLRLLTGSLSMPAPVPLPTAAIDGHWTAEVLTLGSTSDGQQRATLLVRGASAGSAAPLLGPWRTYAWLPRYPAVIPTDRLDLDETIEPVRQDGSTFTRYLASIDVVATVRVREMRVSPAPLDAFGIAEHVRSAADAALARVLPEPMAGLASGILIGRRDRVSREVTDSFTTTGLSHVVAISGWNICLVAAVIGSLLSAIGISRRSRTLVIVVALAAFTLLAGGGASVVRAALMGGVALVARETGRPGSAAAALGLAVWLLLLSDPGMVTDVGFQLSVMATAGLLAWGARLTHRLAGPEAGRSRRWLAESMGVSLAAQAATLPLVLFHFGRLSLVSPVANLVIAPLVAPAMLVGVVALVAGLGVGAGLPFVVGAPFALLGWLVLGAMIAVSGILAAVPLASLELPPMAATLLAVGTAAGVGVVARRALGRAAPVDPPPTPRARPVSRLPAPPGVSGSSGRWWPRAAAAVGVGGLVMVASLGVVLAARSGSGRLTVTALDVGQGDAILVEGPRGGRMLLDSGPDPDRLLTVLDRHVPAWDRRLDLVILTHPHEDHVAGLAMLLGRYRVAAIAENGMLGAGPGDAAFRRWLAVAHVSPRHLAAGDRLSLDGVPIVVRWPIRGEVPARSPSVGRAVNDTSIVLDLRYGERRMLLTGDIEDDVDPRLLTSGIGAGDRRLDVLKVAHHGSRTATSEAWLDALQPLVAMVSAGIGNPYGHPAPQTIERLRAHGARVLRTDLDGDLQVSTDGHDLRSATSGGRPRADVGPPGVTSSLGTTPFATGFLCAIPLSASRLAALPAPSPPHRPLGRPVEPGPRPPGPLHPGPPVEGIGLDGPGDRVDQGWLVRGRLLTIASGLDTVITGPRACCGGRTLPGRLDGSRGPPGRPGCASGPVRPGASPAPRRVPPTSRTGWSWAYGRALATICGTMVPTHAAAAALFLSLSPSVSLRRHASAVADVASYLAVNAVRAGHPVDRAVVEAAALLHDLDKALPPDDPLRALGHGHAGARWLVERGYQELAPAVDTHPVDRLAQASYEEWVQATTIEQRIVAYADKRAQRRVVTLDQRFGRWDRRHPGSADWLAVSRQRAGFLEAEICALAGVSPVDVARHSWAAAALRTAEEHAAEGQATDGSPRERRP